jgi:hypothetical protein
MKTFLESDTAKDWGLLYLLFSFSQGQGMGFIFLYLC